jgi:hypothetical protein
LKTTNTIASAIAAAFLALSACTRELCADIIISDFSLTANSVSFNISGTFPNTAPPSDRMALYIVNPDPGADPGFILETNIDASSSFFTGAQDLRFFSPVKTGSPNFGNYFWVAFDADITIGEAISGTLTAGWNSTVFDPSAVANLYVFWGADYAFTYPVVGGIQLATVPVPEPSGMCFVALSCIALMVQRRSLPSNTAYQRKRRAEH